MMRDKIILVFIIILFPAQNLLSQGKTVVNMPVVLNIPTVSLVDFAGSDKKISFITGKGAEQIITPSTLDKTWLNYSSISDGKSTFVISANISSGSLPAEIVIKLHVGQNVGAGAGKTGRPVGTISLTQYPQDIIVDIGSCFTGRGIQKGHQLIYSWEWLPPYNVNHSSVDSLEISVTYTITTAK